MGSSDVWFANAVADGEFPMPDGSAETSITTIADAVKIYDDQLSAALERVKAMSGEQLAANVSMMGAFNEPAVIYLSFLIRHTVHHRGQLSAYLRPMGAKVPSIYGGSADDSLYHKLKGRVNGLTLIGDALAPRRLMDAILDGARAGRRL